MTTKKKTEKRTYLKDPTPKMEFTDTIYVHLLHLGYQEVELSEIDSSFKITTKVKNPLSREHEEVYPFYINKEIKRFHLTDKSFYN